MTTIFEQLCPICQKSAMEDGDLESASAGFYSNILHMCRNCQVELSYQRPFNAINHSVSCATIRLSQSLLISIVFNTHKIYILSNYITIKMFKYNSYDKMIKIIQSIKKNPLFL